MALNLDKIGVETRSHQLDYDWKTLVLYALGIGATERELDYLYERRGPKIYPSFAVVPNYPVLTDLIELSGGSYSMLVHGGQTVRVLGALPNAGTLRSSGRITAMYDLKRMAQVILQTTTFCGEQPVFETEWQLIFRGEGGFGGERRPRPPALAVPKRDPDWASFQPIAPTLPHLYRLSGDTNPLHVDPEFAASVGFERGPILHGLATFGILCRAVTWESCAGDATRIRSLTAQFRNPVWPGETVKVEGYSEPGRVLLQAFANDRPEAVISGAAAEFFD